MDVPKISWTLVHAQLAVLSAIGGATGAWCTWRQIYKRRLEREGKVVKSDLENHHPDEARHFMQYGYRTSRVGYAVMHCWTAALMVGYVLVVVGCWIGYAIFADLYFPPSAEYWRSIFESWDGVMFPWCVVFVLSHLLLGLVLIFWDAIKSQTMLPATSMREATHLMIQEVHDAGTGPLSPQGPRATTRRRHHRGARSPSLRERCGERCAALSRYLKRVQATEVLPICSEEGRRYVEHMCVRYTYCDRAQSFVPAGQLRPQPSEILKLRKRGGLSEAEALQSRERSGPNAIHVRVPGRLEALVKEFSHFTYIFNSFGVWIYIGYTTWNIGLLWLLMTLGSGLYRALGITRPNQKKVANLARVHQTCSVLREGKYKDVDVTEIALGDIVQVNAGRDVELPCDGLLISGSLIVNESMLTGEPMPVAKTPIESDEIRPKSNKVFAGTRVLESEGLPEDQHRALVYCTEVGALTTRGSLVRMVLFPASVRFKYTEQLPQVYGIMCLYACVLILLKFTSVNEGSWVVKFLNIACCLVGALNPMLPVSLVMGQSASAKRLTDGENYQIKCLQPGRIPIAGKISTMVFDKTGTITKSSMDLAAVHPIADAQLLRCQRLDGAPDGAFAAGEALWRALRRCHTVKQLQDGRMVGNELECAMLRRMREMGDEVPEDASVTVRELEFDHQSMTSGVVLRRERDGFLEVFLKGSPEKIKAAARASSCPSDYDATVTEYAKANYYTIGVSHKMLPQDLTHQEVCALAREELEKEADLVGLLLFQNEMKAEAPEAIRQLKEGNVRSVICTGDSALTGIAIGRQCGIVEKPILHAVLAEGQLRFSDEKDQQVCDPLDPRYQLALSCSAWRHLCEHEPELLQEIWPRCVVFGRMKPVDKINVIKLFQRQGLIVGMAGDGGNDCGALRAAHAGLALSTAEASLVAPFSTGRQEKVSGNQITLQLG
ncbi:unnamed protein product [Durusdinium trenchii]|uniref:P-type ATPase A domain-containing protein n=2 Tax=Durusdinium trenchii TaxID=1381693 RepID=A0ABP0N908_9DINO